MRTLIPYKKKKKHLLFFPSCGFADLINPSHPSLQWLEIPAPAAGGGNTSPKVWACSLKVKDVSNTLWSHYGVFLLGKCGPWTLDPAIKVFSKK